MKTLRDMDAVVIGASAGGVEALQRLLGNLSKDFAVPVLVVLHLPRDRPSLIVDLLGRNCALSVNEAFDKQPIGPGVLFVPPDYHMLVEPDRCIALSMDEPVLFSRPAIDPLFESAAAVYGERLLAILLTGASGDGSLGGAAVRRCGGTLWIQQPGDAAVATMPAAALAHAGADAVLTLNQICSRLAACQL